MQRMVVIGWGLSFGPVLDWLVVSNRIARLRNLSVGGVHGHISSGWLQADIDSVNRLSWIAMTDVTEGGDTGCEPLLANTHLGLSSAASPQPCSSQLHALVVAVSRRLSTTPTMIRLKMTVANSSNQPQCWAGWRRTRMKWRP